MLPIPMFFSIVKNMFIATVWLFMLFYILIKLHLFDINKEKNKSILTIVITGIDAIVLIVTVLTRT